MKKLLARLWEQVKSAARWIHVTWPYGYLCDFEWGHQGRIRLTKSLWVIVGDERTGTDALPVAFVSQELVDRLAEELSKKWYAPKMEEAA